MLVNAAFPVWAALSFVCAFVRSRARALLKFAETESRTMTSSVFFTSPNINSCLRAGCVKCGLTITEGRD